MHIQGGKVCMGKEASVYRDRDKVHRGGKVYRRGIVYSNTGRAKVCTVNIVLVCAGQKGSSVYGGGVYLRKRGQCVYDKKR